MSASLDCPMRRPLAALCLLSSGPLRAVRGSVRQRDDALLQKCTQLSSPAVDVKLSTEVTSTGARSLGWHRDGRQMKQEKPVHIPCAWYRATVSDAEGQKDERAARHLAGSTAP